MRDYQIADLCCCGGLGADGYADVFSPRALHGYDIVAQPDYPYRFTRVDVIDLLARPADRANPLHRVNALHNSFPCQAHTTAQHLRTAQGGKSRFPDLLTPGLALLREHWTHKHWVVENVEDNQGKVRAIMAPREGETLTMLCGSMFGLQVKRHRLFLTNFPVPQPPPVPHPINPKTGKPRVSKYRDQGCDHDTFPADPITGKPRPWGVWHVQGDSVPSGGRSARDAAHAAEVMGADRVLPWDTAKEGFPPAYTRYVGAALLAAMEAEWVA